MYCKNIVYPNLTSIFLFLGLMDNQREEEHASADCWRENSHDIMIHKSICVYTYYVIGNCMRKWQKCQKFKESHCFAYFVSIFIIFSSTVQIIKMANRMKVKLIENGGREKQKRELKRGSG